MRADMRRISMRLPGSTLQKVGSCFDLFAFIRISCLSSVLSERTGHQPYVDSI